MDKQELLILAASNIAGGMAAAVFGKPGGQFTAPVIENIAQLSITITHRIAEEAAKHPLK